MVALGEAAEVAMPLARNLIGLSIEFVTSLYCVEDKRR